MKAAFALALLIVAIVVPWAFLASTPDSSERAAAASAMAAASSPAPDAARERPIEAAAAEPGHGPEARPAPGGPLSLSETWTLESWLRERGYAAWDTHADGSMTERVSDYTAMSDATLLELAAQNDRRAHQLIAQRMLAATPAIEMSPDAAARAADHLWQASIGGYTATLAELSRLHQLRILASGKRDPAAMLDAWAYALVGVTRGDPDSESELWSLETFPPVPMSAEVKVQAAARANQLLRDLEAERRARGLPPFEHGMPDDIRSLQRRAVIEALR